MSEGKLYYSIGEVAAMLDVNPSLLRFWESEFDCIRPVKNKKGTRSYTQKDIELLQRIHHLTKECGFTLEGAREQLKNNTVLDERMQMVENLKSVKNFLIELKEVL